MGVVEAIFIAYRGAGGKEIKELLFKKIIASPVQQAVSAITKIVFLPMIAFWTLNYALSQGVIKLLPDCLNHKRMNIFINGGITDKGSDKSWFTEESEPIPPPQREHTPEENSSGARRQAPTQTPLRKRVAEASASMHRINNPNISREYSAFKQKVLDGRSARELFGFGNTPLTGSSLRKRFRELSLVLHPDRNPDSVEEANLLFCCLYEAYLELQQEAEQ